MQSLLPLNFRDLFDAIDEASTESPKLDMLVFVTMPDPNRPGKTMEARVTSVTVATYHDPGETNHSVWIHLTEPKEMP